jgi:hypothetical protein
MESVANVNPEPMRDLMESSQQSWYWLIFTTVLFGALWYFVNSAVDIAKISRDWPKYRCNPAVMPFASVYGYNAAENFNYCMTSMFQSQTGSVTGPFGSILGVIVQNMFTFLKSLNSIRVMIATFIGGIRKLTQEFVDRFKLLFAQVKTTGLRLRWLFGRVVATMYSVLYMGMSAITAGLNFGDTFIFRFIDTFCFAPETLVEIEGKGKISIQDVRLGDVFVQGGATVTSTYRFAADGQPMVFLDGIEVSTNHYVKHEGRWIQSKDHPMAKPCGNWSGGNQRPLICLDTDKHEIPIQNFIFSDWDETDESDEATMILAEKRLNGGRALNEQRPWLYQPAFLPNMNIKTKDRGYIPASRLQCGDILATRGRVTGVGRRLVKQIVRLPQGEIVTPSSLLWTNEGWIRAGHMYPEQVETLNTPMEMTTAVVFGVPVLETGGGVFLRDMCEVHSPDMEEPTTNALDPTMKSKSPN